MLYISNVKAISGRLNPGMHRAPYTKHIAGELERRLSIERRRNVATTSEALQVDAPLRPS